MARVFVRLKLRLLANGLRRSTAQTVGIVLGAVFLLPTAVGVAIGLAVLGRTTQFGEPVSLGLIALFGLVWLLGPSLLFGTDETLDPLRLSHLPLRRGDLVVGMSAASLVGLGPLSTVIVFAGIAAGLTPAGPGALVVLAGLAAQLLFCVVGARAVTTALAAKLRSRRGRDLIAVVGTLTIALSGQVPNLLTNTVGPDALAQALERAAAVAGLLPIGWAGSAVVAGAEGRLLAGLGWLVAAAAATVGLGWWWTRSLATMSSQAEEAPRTAGADIGLFPALARWLPRNRVGAAAARELRYLTREPRYRIALILQIVFAVVLGGFVLFALDEDPRAVLVAAVLAVPFALGTLNAFGAESGATWLLVAVGGDHRTDLAGKNLAYATVALPLVLVAAAGIAVRGGGWQYVPVAVAAAAGLLLVAQGVGNVASVVAPFPQPENPFGGQQGQGLAQAALQMLAFTVIALLMAPAGVAVAVVAVTAPAWIPLAAAGALAYGVAIWWAGLGLGARRLSARGPEILTALRAQ